MKKLILFFTLFIIAFSAAQAQFFNEKDVDLYKKDISKEARNLVKEHMGLTADQAKVFWPIYDEYDKSVDKLMDEEIGIIEEYLMNYYDLSADKAKELISKSFDLDAKKLDLDKKYLDKMYAVLPANVVGKFYQINKRISLMEQVQKTSKIPLIQKQEK